MPRRNYQELSSYDFECLTRDLLAKEWGVRLESFAAGSDGGIDVRFLDTEGRQLITVQCKHSPNKSFSDIKAALTKEARKRKGGRDLGVYWLATSANLSPNAKDEIARIFADQALLPERVLGRDDLDALLDNHPEVERANYKLYITSTTVMELLLRRDLFVHAQDLLDGIEERRKYYVQGDVLAEAQQMLIRNRVIVISGPPGVGKTTLAEMLALNLISEGFTPYWVSEDAREADALWSPSEPQLFLYDDFLGQNTLGDKLGKNEDGRLLSLMKRVQRSSSHYLVLTTREYILKGAQQTYERLHDSSIKRANFVLDLSSYNRHSRAHILYNHVYFSELGDAARSALRIKHNYSAIVDHPNYNPRLIRFIIDTAVREGGDDAGSNFPKFALNSLNNPGELWDHIFHHQLKQAERDVLITMSLFSAPVEVSRLKKAALEFQLTLRGRRSAFELQNALAILDGVFLYSYESYGQSMIQFANPGIRDFVLSQLDHEPSIYSELVSSTIFHNQIHALWLLLDSDRYSLLFNPLQHLPNIRQEFLLNPEPLLNAAVRLIDTEPTEEDLQWWDSRTVIASIALQITSGHLPSRFAGTLDLVSAALTPRWLEIGARTNEALSLCKTVSSAIQLLSLDMPDSAKRIFDAAISLFERTELESPDFADFHHLLAMRYGDYHLAPTRLRREFVTYATGLLEDMIELLPEEQIWEFDLIEIENAADELNVTDELEDLLEKARTAAEAFRQATPRAPADDPWPQAPDRGSDEDRLFSCLD